MIGLPPSLHKKGPFDCRSFTRGTKITPTGLPSTTLPFDASPTTRPDIPASPAKVADGSNKNRPQFIKLIYIVDDDPLNLSAFKRLLQRFLGPGVRIETFDQSDNFIAKSREEAPDMVFLDYAMQGHGVNGDVLARQLRTDGYNGWIIANTTEGSFVGVDDNSGGKIGFDRFVRKFFNLTK
ncbi:response regulator [Candidatus Saganbacteria bacterium]|nr:response regulator [Candidatus Saganbacteria bacterium]